MRKYGFLVLAALALSACGGNSTSSFAGSGSASSSSSGASVTAAAITMISSVPQIPSSNGTPATITAIVKNASNAVVPGATVVFSTTSGVIAPTAVGSAGVAGVTDSSGQASATLTTPGDPSNRTITVTATVGSVSAKIDVTVVGTKLTLSGATSLTLGSTGSFSAALTDAGGSGIANTTVTLASANGNTLSAPSSTTDASGHVTFSVTAVNAGTDTVTATALGLSAAAPLSVSSQNFVLSAPAANADVALNIPQAVTVVWKNNGAPVANQPVSFSTTRGLFTGNVTTIAGTTDSTGSATVTISSLTAGPAMITASATGVSSQVTIFFIATNPTQITLQASPSTVQTSGGQSTLSAIVRDAADNLVQGQTVDFQLTDKTGGSISVPSAVTDSQGVAQTVYTSTSTPSSSKGVTVLATLPGTQNPANGNNPYQASTTLTVGGLTVFLTLGTGNQISAPNITQFDMPYVVQAQDSAGNAVAGVNVTLTVHSYPYADIPAGQTQANGSTSPTYAAYEKGYWTAVGAGSGCNGVSGTVWCQVITADCFNEDINASGVLLGTSEDINGNGRLDPADVASVSPGSVVTDSTGSGHVDIIYAQDHAAWVHVKLTASATVAGTESTTSAYFWLPILAEDINTTTNGSPPGNPSPYGIATACTNPN